PPSLQQSFHHQSPHRVGRTAGYKRDNMYSLLLNGWKMNATLGLDVACPATGTWILPGFDSLGAGPTADARIAIIMQRIVRQVIFLDVFPDLVIGPCRQRVELDHPVGIIPFDQAGICTESRLIAADPGDP